METLTPPKERTDWFSRNTNRRGWIKWATNERVCICFSTRDRNATKIHSLEDFLRLYRCKKEEDALRK
jgi:hypothetical protein